MQWKKKKEKKKKIFFLQFFFFFSFFLLLLSYFNSFSIVLHGFHQTINEWFLDNGRIKGAEGKSHHGIDILIRKSRNGRLKKRRRLLAKLSLQKKRRLQEVQEEQEGQERKKREQLWNRKIRNIRKTNSWIANVMLWSKQLRV